MRRCWRPMATLSLALLVPAFAGCATLEGAGTGAHAGCLFGRLAGGWAGCLTGVAVGGLMGGVTGAAVDLTQAVTREAPEPAQTPADPRAAP